MTEQASPPGAIAAQQLGLPHRVIHHGAVGSLAEAAIARGVEPADVVKTMVVRRGPDDHVFVLVPGDRKISWPKLRVLLGVNRLSMPQADEAFRVTGYPRGTITPFGAKAALPVIADARLAGRVITLGAGVGNTALAVDADQTLAALKAQIADVTDPEPPTAPGEGG